MTVDRMRREMPNREYREWQTYAVRIAQEQELDEKMAGQ